LAFIELSHSTSPEDLSIHASSAGQDIVEACERARKIRKMRRVSEMHTMAEIGAMIEMR
jgi:hypothetical protein